MLKVIENYPPPALKEKFRKNKNTACSQANPTPHEASTGPACYAKSLRKHEN
jgi:hypothetical protein